MFRASSEYSVQISTIIFKRYLQENLKCEITKEEVNNMGLLKEIVEQNHAKFARNAKDWQDSIRMSCEVLEADGTVEDNYKEDIIECIKKYGPYIVITPGIALPHSQENAVGVHKTAIAFMKLEEAVYFDEGNNQLDANVFFTLASCDSEKHLENMSKLSELLMDEGIQERLKRATSIEDLLEIDGDA